MALSDVVARLHGHRRGSEHPVSQLPRSLVSVLDDEAELQAAVARAIEFERGVARRAEEKISRYEQITRQTTLAALSRTDPDVVVPMGRSEQTA